MLGGKSQLAVEICELSDCANLHQSHGNKSPFVNWYLVLGVDENADVECIRKRYHKLALQVHPDKNNHSKAETAFKLVSQAYLCLSDKARRAAFDSQRNIFSCNKCNNNNSSSRRNTNAATQKPYQQTRRSDRVHRQMKELRMKLKEEAVIIEKCLTANAASSARKYQTNARAESPVFNPSDYQHKGYPHYRAINYSRMQDLMAGFTTGNRCLHDTVKNAYPVFQYRPERSTFHV